MIPPPAQRAMADRAEATVSEVAADHSLHVSQARATAAAIKQARGRPVFLIDWGDLATAHLQRPGADRTLRSSEPTRAGRMDLAIHRPARPHPTLSLATTVEKVARSSTAGTK